jgi:RsiW-degrading membrane proteinase PrsW (M82 family)
VQKNVGFGSMALMDQLWIIGGQLVITVGIAWLWVRRDRKTAKKRSQREEFGVLLRVFLLAVFLTFVLRGLGTFAWWVLPYSFLSGGGFLVIGLFLEEFAKILAIVLGLELAGDRFNELSDGLMYAVFAALGFVFYENITYLLPLVGGPEVFSAVFVGRNVFTFGAHVFTALFGVFYAFAYLYSKKHGSASRVKPWQVFRQLGILWKQFGVLFFVWLPVSPFVSLWKFFTKARKTLSIPELLWSGVLGSFYLHFSYDVILQQNNHFWSGVVLAVVGFAIYGIYRAFPRLKVDVR